MSTFKLTTIDDRRAAELRARARSKLFFALRKAAKARGVGIDIMGKDIADALGKDRGFVSRILNGTNQSMDFETLVAFLEVLGFNVDLDVKSLEELAHYKSNNDVRSAQLIASPRSSNQYVSAKPSLSAANNGSISGRPGAYNVQ